VLIQTEIIIIIIEDMLFLKTRSCRRGILLSRVSFFFRYAQSPCIQRAY